MKTSSFAFWLLSSLLVGCGVTQSATSPPPEDTGAPDVAIDAADVAIDSAADTIATSDGTVLPARRLPCVDRAGLAGGLPSDAFGALEGELVAIVLPGVKSCPSDADHLHLQVDISGKRYDVAVTVDSSTGGTPIALVSKDLAATTAAPGWSSAGFDFPKDLGIPSADFKPMTKAELLARLQTELATASFVSIHGRSYTDGTGVHNVHRNGGVHDGLILIRGAGAGGADHAIALRFSTDVF